ncbi:glycoside hydrolase family 32 protein [Pectobacterium cacticida]|uniref:glycoside hydrolase family 32 protein n=1 Tax=Pectobacterium cacticida TaxID=69221 RepID=UPI003985D02A
MMKSRLITAELAREALLAQRGNTFYPHYHLAPPAGWMNDPNGLIYFNGLYHAFYQHHPMSEHWGPMHWGHATSPDMVHWRHEPIALAPGDEYDLDGCFSGSAVDDDGALSLIYTGHVWLAGVGNDSAIREVQCLAISHDGIHFEKRGVILTPPEGIMHFRDPKVWRADGEWWMVVGARDNHDTGQVLLYRGASLTKWRFERVLAHANAQEGYMWECPDFFPLGKHDYLLFSPQGMQAEGYHYRNRFQSGVLQGQWQPETGFKRTSAFAELDHGHDFYAPQSFLTPDGRRVILGWMDMWESPMPSKQEGWAGALTLPRELVECDGTLHQRPVRELESLRQQRQMIEPMPIAETYLIAPSAIAAELIIRWDTARSQAEHYGVRLGEGLRLYVDNQAKRLVLWRRYPHGENEGYRSIALPSDDHLKIRLFIDSSSVEVFVNDGEACMTSRIYLLPEKRALTLYSSQGESVMLGGEFWHLGDGFA